MPLRTSLMSSIKVQKFPVALAFTLAIARSQGAYANVVIEASVDGGALQTLLTSSANPTPANGPGTGQITWTGWISKTSHSTSSSTNQTFFLNAASAAGM